MWTSHSGKSSFLIIYDLYFISYTTMLYFTIYIWKPLATLSIGILYIHCIKSDGIIAWLKVLSGIVVYSLGISDEMHIILFPISGKWILILTLVFKPNYKNCCRIRQALC